VLKTLKLFNVARSNGVSLGPVTHVNSLRLREESMLNSKAKLKAAAAVACGAVLLALCGAGVTRIVKPVFADDTGMVVEISSGKIRGNPVAPGGAEFVGIPYAQPPVGDLRWREPSKAKSWEGVREAKEFGAPCAQAVAGDWNKHDAETGKEDCLFLNVITPRWPSKGSLPVMVWLHGGGNSGGTASSELYKDGTLVKHGVVLVTANYRLGVFGFFADARLTRESAHHASGNYGLLDQIAALRWVHDNIAKFGGDPQNVTLFGQSAGAIDTAVLMTSPLAKELFRRAIAESGSALVGPPELAAMEKESETWIQSLKIPAGQDALKYLRALSADDLWKVVNESAPEARPVSGLGIVVDGWVLPRNPGAVFAAGEEADIPLIIGNTAREFAFPSPPDVLKESIKRAYGDLAPRALVAYGLGESAPTADDPLYGSPAGQFSADTMFRCPGTTQAIWHAAAHHPTYSYQFERAIPGHESEGALHSGDLPYVFGFYPKTGNIGGVFGDDDYKMANLIEEYWTNFAKTGNPNVDALPNWPEFDGTQAYIEFTQDVRVVAKTGLRHEQCDLYRENLKRLMAR
jgi:para-nitrobenzyl esterase